MDAVSDAGHAQQQLIVAVEQIRSGWEVELAEHRNIRALRTDAAAWQVLTCFPATSCSLLPSSSPTRSG